MKIIKDEDIFQIIKSSPRRPGEHIMQCNICDTDVEFLYFSHFQVEHDLVMQYDTEKSVNADNFYIWQQKVRVLR